MNEKFILMNKNKPLIKFECLTRNNEFGTIYDFKILKIQKENKEIFPISLETTEEGLKEWIKTRKVPKNRAFVEKILETLVENENLKHPMDYIKVSFGLSLNDSYWIIPDDGKQYLWENYNLYKNKFSKTLSLVAFTGYNSQIKDVRISPEYTTNGMLKKCWHQKEDGIYLLKGATEEYSNSGKEHYSEFYSAQVAEILGLNHIEYDLEKFHDELVSSCKLFTSEDVGYEPMINIFKSKNIKCTDLDAGTIYEIKNLLKEEFIKFEDMMLFDAIIGNKDRHLGNFGMLINNTSGRLIILAPIFDNGLSMINFMTKNEISDKEYLKKFNSEKTNAFNQTFDEAMKIFSNKRHIANLIKLKNFKVKKHKRYNLDDEWLSGFEKNIRLNAEKCLEIIKEKILIDEFIE
ncbi:MAG: HipA family kinase [Streptobacillus sp.]